MYKIGDLAKRTGKTTRALRHYEELGLLAPGTRTTGGFRVYDESAIGRVHWIGQLQDLGFTLHDIQHVVGIAAGMHVPREAMARVRGMFTDKLTDVANQIQRLRSLQRELSEALTYLESCQACSVQPSTRTQVVEAVACADCAEHGDLKAPALIQGLTASAAHIRPATSPHSTAAPSTSGSQK